MAPRLRDATAGDWLALTSDELAPAYFTGIACVDGDWLLGMGGAYRCADGLWWMFFMRAPGVCMLPVIAHKAALILAKSCVEAGMTVHALADPSIDGSEKWLRRVGFKQTEQQRHGHSIWTL